MVPIQHEPRWTMRVLKAQPVEYIKIAHDLHIIVECGPCGGEGLRECLDCFQVVALPVRRPHAHVCESCDGRGRRMICLHPTMEVYQRFNKEDLN